MDSRTMSGGDGVSGAAGNCILGIELGSTRIKACLIDALHPSDVVATGSHTWENRLDDGHWTYRIDDVWDGIRAALADVRRRAADGAGRVTAIGVSGMMHGYLAFDASGTLLTPFRTWRDTTTGPAAAELSALFGMNIPLRWSIAHLHQAVLNGEEHVGRIARVTTLAGYVHWALTGRAVVGVGDASGMFPVDASTADFDIDLATRYDTAVAGRLPGPVRALLPAVLRAGQEAGRLTARGADRLDQEDWLTAGIPLCPPEGDAATGMVAANAIAPRSGTISVGTSIFSMVVLERPWTVPSPTVDVVATPTGEPVAMVHCNNGADELAAWATVFGRFAAAVGSPVDPDTVFGVLLGEALSADTDAGGVIAYNYVSGEPIAQLDHGVPLVMREPAARLTLANLMRAQSFSIFATLAIGMRTLAGAGVAVERMVAQGGIFRTHDPAGRLLAAALGVPVVVAPDAAAGGAWGMAVLAAFHAAHPGVPPTDAPAELRGFLGDTVFAERHATVYEPDPADGAGFAAYLRRFEAGLTVASAAAATFRSSPGKAHA